MNDIKRLKTAMDTAAAAYQSEYDKGLALAVSLVAAQRAATNDIAAYEACRAASADYGRQYDSSCARMSDLAESFEIACRQYDAAVRLTADTATL
jgi:hypothetical protein